MTTRPGGLGKDFDIGHTIAVIDLDAATTLTTGKNVYMGDCKGVTFIVSKGKGTTDDFALDLQEIDTVAGSDRLGAAIAHQRPRLARRMGHHRVRAVV